MDVSLKDEFSLEAEFYDKIWGRYDYDADVKFLEGLFRDYGCESIIDIGCGTGNHAIRLSRSGFKVTGLDISSAMLKLAKEKSLETEIEFIQGDMRNIKNLIPEGQKFDGAICLGITFCHLIENKDVQAFLNGLHKILRKNGLFIFNARNARKIDEGHLNRLILDHIIMDEGLQLLFLFYNTRDTQNKNVIVWRPIYLINKGGKVDFQIREHKLRWFQFSKLKRMLTEHDFKVVATYSGPTKEEFKEEKNAEMWFVTTAK